jgi:hypothetical protein
MERSFYSGRKKQKEIHQPIVLKFLLSDLIAEFLAQGEKSESSQKYPTNRVWSSLLSIGTIIFSQMLH